MTSLTVIIKAFNTGRTDAQKGYLVSTGCDIPVDTDPENIFRFMDTVAQCGPVRLGQKPSKLYR